MIRDRIYWLLFGVTIGTGSITMLLVWAARLFSSDKLEMRIHEKEVEVETEIKDMKLGDVGYAVPWAVEVEAPGDKPHIGGGHTVVPSRGGTSELYIKRVRGGVSIDWRGIPYDDMFPLTWGAVGGLPIVNSPPKDYIN